MYIPCSQGGSYWSSWFGGFHPVIDIVKDSSIWLPLRRLRLCYVSPPYGFLSSSPIIKWLSCYRSTHNRTTERKLNRLMFGHTNLKANLGNMRLIENPTCNYGLKHETPHYVLLHCKLYDTQTKSLINSIELMYYRNVPFHLRTIDFDTLNGFNFYAMLKCLSLWNQCDIPHSGIVCDITPLQNFFFDIKEILWSDGDERNLRASDGRVIKINHILFP